MGVEVLGGLAAILALVAIWQAAHIAALKKMYGELSMDSSAEISRLRKEIQDEKELRELPFDDWWDKQMSQ